MHCTWADGSQITFDAPLPDSTAQLTHIAFDATGPGCSWHFLDNFQQRWELTVDGMMEVSTFDGKTLDVECANGTSYEGDVAGLSMCQPPVVLPNDAYEVSPKGFAFRLNAVNAPQQLFMCMQ